MYNPFFENKGPLNILEILDLLNLDSNKFQNQNIYDIKDLLSSTNKKLG